MEWCAVLALMLALVAFASTNKMELKTKFGNELGLELRKYEAAYMMKSMDTLDRLYTTLLGDMRPSVATRLKFTKRLAEIKMLKSSIDERITSETMGQIKRLSIESAFELLEYRMCPVIQMDASRQQILIKALQLAAVNELAALNDFVVKITNKWGEMFKKIPNDEMNKNKNYEQINEAFGTITQVNITNIEDSAIMSAPLQKLADFFGYAEIQTMLRVDTF